MASRGHLLDWMPSQARRLQANRPGTRLAWAARRKCAGTPSSSRWPSPPSASRRSPRRSTTNEGSTGLRGRGHLGLGCHRPRPDASRAHEDDRARLRLPAPERRGLDRRRRRQRLARRRARARPRVRTDHGCGLLCVGVRPTVDAPTPLIGPVPGTHVFVRSPRDATASKQRRTDSEAGPAMRFGSPQHALAARAPERPAGLLA